MKMPESASQRVARAYRRGYLNALQTVAGALERNEGPINPKRTDEWLRAYADKIERDGVPRKDTP